MKMNEEQSIVKKRKMPMWSFYILAYILSVFVCMFHYGNSFLISLLISIPITLVLMFLIYITPKSKIDKDKLKEEINKLTSDEIRDKIKYNKEFNKQGNKVIDKRKDYTLSGIFEEFLFDIITFGTPILFFTFIFLGALGSNYNIPSQDFFNNVTYFIGYAGNTTIGTFYHIGAENPKPMIVIYYLSIFMAFIYPIIILIYNLIKYNLKRR